MKRLQDDTWWRSVKLCWNAATSSAFETQRQFAARAIVPASINSLVEIPAEQPKGADSAIVRSLTDHEATLEEPWTPDFRGYTTGTIADEEEWRTQGRKRRRRVFSESREDVSTESPAWKAKPKPRVMAAQGTQFKFTLRPEQGIKLDKYGTHVYGRAIVDAVGKKHICTVSDFSFQVMGGSNSIFLMMEREDTAKEINEIQARKLEEGRTVKFNVHQVLQNVTRGVIHNVGAECKEQEILEIMRTKTGVELIAARRLGESKVVLLTFSGHVKPRYVYFYGGAYRVYEYTPRRQVCYRCMRVGHRADVCPYEAACRDCGKTHPKEEGYVIKCVLCGKGHRTGDRECEKKYKAPPEGRFRNLPKASTWAGHRTEQAANIEHNVRTTETSKMHEILQQIENLMNGGTTALLEVVRNNEELAAEGRKQHAIEEKKRAEAKRVKELREAEQRKAAQAEREKLQAKRRDEREKQARAGQEDRRPIILERRTNLMALQEVKTIAKVMGYEAYVNRRKKPAVATLVSKNHTAIVHDTEQDIENVLIELVPKRRRRNESGKKLLETIEEEGLSIENEVWNPTRTGGGRTSDTSPDLTICKNVKVKWLNTCENLGSDHYIIEIEMETDLRERSIGKTRHTNWEDFRKDAELDGVTDPVVWAKKIKEVMKKNTSEVTLTPKYPAADNKLMAMWDERRKLTRRWKRQRYNRKIGKRVTEMDRQIEEYAQQLARHNWEQRCEDMKNGKGLGNKDTWALLNYLVDPTKMRSEVSKTMQRIIHQFKGSDHELMEYVRQRYIPDGTRGKELPEYSGRPNQESDEEIRIGEVKAAAREERNSTPGRDGVTNGALRNLPEKEYRRLTDMFNEVWKQGKLPDEWKQSDIKFISKPGKNIGLENLRPISLTSAVGKLMERVVKNRLQPYIEENGFFHNAMFGFRPYLSTQDMFALLKENVLDEFP
ncbi:hypothetical protein HPB47_016401 [Ixodes persulcatus]|uniref:Uncharacterized protein n=1 Tax=Ixodes persulcatus TaxID=34615 RepID=A0AC60QR03_IXOPE|nr:hypothetical protein HPB47_016401 [Ixodes persulcatus]